MDFSKYENTNANKQIKLKIFFRISYLQQPKKAWLWRSSRKLEYEERKEDR